MFLCGSEWGAAQDGGIRRLATYYRLATLLILLSKRGLRLFSTVGLP